MTSRPSWVWTHNGRASGSARSTLGEPFLAAPDRSPALLSPALCSHGVGRPARRRRDAARRKLNRARAASAHLRLCRERVCAGVAGRGARARGTLGSQKRYSQGRQSLRACGARRGRRARAARARRCSGTPRPREHARRGQERRAQRRRPSGSATPGWASPTLGDTSPQEELSPIQQRTRAHAASHATCAAARVARRAGCAGRGAILARRFCAWRPAPRGPRCVSPRASSHRV